VKFKKFFSLSVCLLVAITVLDFLAFKNFWYWRWPWFDKPMHFMGGLLAGLVAIQLFLYFRRRHLRDVSGLDFALVSLLAAVVIGGLWEVLEFTADKFYVAHVELKTLDMLYNGWQGSLKDLLFDLIGSVVATILFLISFIWQNKKAR
jgi:hypothetical protein